MGEKISRDTFIGVYVLSYIYVIKITSLEKCKNNNRRFKFESQEGK